MRHLATSIVIGSLALMGALPAAGQSPSRPGSGAFMQPTKESALPSDRATYTKRARGDMRVWEERFQTFGEDAARNGSEAGDAAANDLRTAWTSAQAASRKLETASAKGWQEARISYERASHDLAGAWHRVHPENT